MSDTRSQVKRELQRMQDCIQSVHLRTGRRIVDVMKKADDVEVYRFCERVLQGILDRTEEPPAVEGES